MLQQYKKLFEDMVVEAGQNLDSLEKEKADLIDDVKEMRASIETMLKNLEEKILSEIGKTRNYKNINIAIKNNDNEDNNISKVNYIIRSSVL
jgi:hypoxanthine phosphoribosyltransferase